MEFTDSVAVGGQIVAGSRRTLVLHVLPQDLNRGAQVYAGKLRDALRDDPEQEHLVVTLFASSVAGARADVALNVSSGPARRLVDVRAVLRLRKLIRARQAQVVVAHGGESLKYVVAAAGGRPTVYYKVGLSSNEVKRLMHRSLYRFLSRKATLVVGNSSAIIHQVESLFGIPASQQALIPNARDTNIYRPLYATEELATPPRVLFVGQLESGKRPELFLDAIESLRQSGHSFDAVMVGDGPLRSTLQLRADSLGVRLLGTRSDVPILMRASAVFVMTSAAETEGMPGVIIEAGLCGVPAVATMAAGVSDVIEDGETGFVVSGHPDDVATRIGEILGNRGLRERLGAAARARCSTRFSIDATSDLWRSLVAGLTNRMGRLRGSRDDVTD